MRSNRDPARSLFGVALALVVASLLLREVHGVEMAYDALAFVWFASWFAGALSVVASLIDAARAGRVRSLYFAVAVVAAQLLGFHADMDARAASFLATVLWGLLGALVVTEVRSLLRPGNLEDEDALAP